MLREDREDLELEVLTVLKELPVLHVEFERLFEELELEV